MPEFFNGLIALILIGLIAICALPFCCQAVKKFAHEQISDTFANGFIHFMDGSSMMLTTSSLINIYQNTRGEFSGSENASITIPVCSLAVVCLWYLLLSAFQCCNYHKLETERIQRRIGVSYETYSLPRAGRGFILLNLW